MPVDTAATNELLSVIAREPQILAVRFVLEQGKYIAKVETNTTKDQVSFLSKSRTIEVRPRARPYSFFLAFSVPFSLAYDPICWVDPDVKPPWITLPERSGNDTRVEMLVVDATDREERAKFHIMPAGHPTGGSQPRPIDPTIVSNPPN